MANRLAAWVGRALGHSNGAPACDQLEDRRMLAGVDAYVQRIDTMRDHWVVAVDYISRFQINTATIGNDDIRVERGAYSAIGAAVRPVATEQDTFVDQANTTWHRATQYYFIPAPGGRTDPEDAGEYTVQVLANGVRNVQGGFTDAGVAYRGVVNVTTTGPQFWLIDARSTPETLTLRLRMQSSLHAPQGQYWQQYMIGTLVTSIGGQIQRIQAIGAHEWAQHPGLIEFRFAAPDGTWDFRDNASYRFEIQPWSRPEYGRDDDRPLRDPIVVSQQNLWYPQPLAEIVSNTMRETDWLIVARYTSNRPIRLDTIDATDLSVTFADGSTLSATLHQSPIVDAPGSVRVVYRVAAPEGVWTPAQNGRATAVIARGSVAETGGQTTLGLNRVLGYLWFQDEGFRTGQVHSATRDQIQLDLWLNDRGGSLNLGTLDVNDLLLDFGGAAATVSSFTTFRYADGRLRVRYTVTPDSGQFPAGLWRVSLRQNAILRDDGEAIDGGTLWARHFA